MHAGGTSEIVTHEPIARFELECVRVFPPAHVATAYWYKSTCLLVQKYLFASAKVLAY